MSAPKYNAGDIAQMLAEQIDCLVADLLPAGHREGHEWRCGSIAGERGDSLGVHLTGAKQGVWADFATENAGDALDLVAATLGLNTGASLAWARRWLGIDDGELVFPRRPQISPQPIKPNDPARWRRPWRASRPITGTLAESYLAARQLRFADGDGHVLRFSPCRVRKSPNDEFEHHPALLAALSNLKTGEQVGILNGLPSCHLTPGRNGRVSSVPSSFHDQPVARSGTIDAMLFAPHPADT